MSLLKNLFGAKSREPLDEHDRELKQQLLKMKKERNKARKDLGEDIPYIVSFFTCNDHEVCDRCRELAQRTYTIEEMMEKLPIKCESESGCRCWLGGRTSFLGKDERGEYLPRK